MFEKKGRASGAPAACRFTVAGAWLGALAAGSSLLAPGCGSRTSEHALDSSRVVENATVDFHRRETNAERFGLRGSTPSDAKRSSDASSSGLSWTTPAGWTETATSSMRVASFHPGGDPRVDCYLTLLGGDGGGLTANVNRWRAQLALSPLAASEIDALPRSELLGCQAVLVDAGGTWQGMSGNERIPNWHLLGLVLVQPGGAAFFKMVGPEDAVVAQRDAFLALARSFKPSTATARGDEIPAGAPTAGNAGGFAFDVPAGWKSAPDRPGRAFTSFASENVECYVTVFPGDGGGLLANVNRWRGQLSVPPITESDLVAMDRVRLLDRDAVVFDCTGSGKCVIGAASSNSDRSVFVKMSGPIDDVGAQRNAFLALCKSLRDAR